MAHDLSAVALDIETLRRGYQRSEFSPADVIEHIYEKSAGFMEHNIWIYQLSRLEIQPYLDRLLNQSAETLPLYGIPFAIKDNIDLERVPTTAACAEFSYMPARSAFIVDLLIKAGAIPLGKTNMDQFATGLVGTRSPWGPCKNAFDKTYISGGSSSGSAVAVALGLASFALGTDTAGSGRVPAMLNNLYGLKPSRGLLSMSGIVPACRSLDCPSIFALSAADAISLFNIAAKFDTDDCYARANPYRNSFRNAGEPTGKARIAIPKAENLEFFGNASSEKLFSQAVEVWKKRGATLVETDIQPLLDAARLLYDGPWVAERYAAIEPVMRDKPGAIHPVVRQIIAGGEKKTAVDAFRYEYRMQKYRRSAAMLLRDVDFLLTPTAPTTYTVDEMLENPVTLNSNMGYYTNYMNLLDLCGVAVPAGEMSNGQQFGVTLTAPAFNEQKLLGYANQWQRCANIPTGATGLAPRLPDLPGVKCTEFIDIAVCGAHLSGMPLNWQLTERGASLKASIQSAAKYRMYALAGGPPYRPGLIRDDANGGAIELEVWTIPATEFGGFVANIPKPLGIGKLELSDGTEVCGFICEPCGIEGAEDITDMGSWRNYIKQQGVVASD
ncbi:MAG: allophanate hydrolase [Pseudomonadales bacterium]